MAPISTDTAMSTFTTTQLAAAPSPFFVNNYPIPTALSGPPSAIHPAPENNTIVIAPTTLATSTLSARHLVAATSIPDPAPANAVRPRGPVENALMKLLTVVKGEDPNKEVKEANKARTEAMEKQMREKMGRKLRRGRTST